MFLWQYTELETILGDVDRARAIYNLAINQPKLDMPEVLWKAFIDFEIGLEEYENTRALYRRLLERTQHVKVDRAAQGQEPHWGHGVVLCGSV